MTAYILRPLDRTLSTAPSRPHPLVRILSTAYILHPLTCILWTAPFRPPAPLRPEDFAKLFEMDREKEIKVVEELLGGLKAGAKRPGKHYPELAARMATFRYQQPKLSLSIAAFLTLSRPISLTQWGLISRYPSILDERAPDLNKSSTFRLCDWTVFLENLMQKNQKWTVLSELFYLGK